MTIDDTIVAISSPPGAGLRGIVRLSGPDALKVAQHVFTLRDGSAFADAAAAVRRAGSIAIDGESIEAAILMFPAGRSYTGQPLVEFHLLGAPTLLAIVVEMCLEAGGRRAEAGEFTARAYLAGRLDLSQAHGVAGMIAAQTDGQLRAAERLLHGRLGEVAAAAREDLADLLSLVEGAMDFADEPIEFIDVATFRTRLEAIRRRLEETTAAGIRAERWGLLPRVVLVGRPNAGKSSLLNRLSGTERAISTPIAGTTRDALSARVELGDSGACLMIDVAGAMAALDSDESGAPSIDVQAREMARLAEKSADVVAIVVDLAGQSSIDDAVGPWLGRQTPRIVVGNKLDAATAERVEAFRDWCIEQPGCVGVVVSAATGNGCELLTSAIASQLGDRSATDRDSAIALMAEHREALERAMETMDRAIALAAACGEELNDADLAATEMRIAAEALGTLVGMDQTEEMLGRIFSRFCVGK